MYTCIQDFTHIERFVIINYDLPMEVKLSCEAFMYERGDKIKVKYNEVIQDSFLPSSAIVIVAPHHRNKMSLAADFINILSQTYIFTTFKRNNILRIMQKKKVNLYYEKKKYLLHVHV